MDIRYRSSCIAFSVWPGVLRRSAHRMVLFVVTEITGCESLGPRRCNTPRGRGTADRYCDDNPARLRDTSRLSCSLALSSLSTPPYFSFARGWCRRFDENPEKTDLTIEKISARGGENVRR